jgi:hypothetical protein
MPTLQPGLRIDAEDGADWNLLEQITRDAAACGESLARRLGNLVDDPDLADDWRDFVIPGLDEAFHADLSHVEAAVSAARLACGGGSGSVWIRSGDARPWYSSLNQARLALEEAHGFGTAVTVEAAGLPRARRHAFLRSQFYCAVQSLLLEHAMR